MSLNAFKYVEDLRKAGVPDKQAEAQIRVLMEIIGSNLATKRDIKELETKIKELEASTKRDIKELETKIKELEASTNRDIKELEIRILGKMVQMEQRMTIKLGSLMVVSITLLVALSQLGVF